MESLEEVIRCLQAINQNMNSQDRAVLPPWQQKVIDEAGYNVPSTLNEPDLRKKAEILDVAKQYGAYVNAMYFCFVPNPNQVPIQNQNQNQNQNQKQDFTVYVIDRNRNVIAKLEQLQLSLPANATLLDMAFIIPIR